MYPRASCAVTAISIAPASTIPWIELAADISGVCKVAGSLLITSKPTHRLRMKMVTSVSRVVDIALPFGKLVPGGGRGGRGAGLRGRLGLRPERGMHHLAVIGDQDAGLQFIIPVDGQHAVLDQVLEQRTDVPRVHRGGRGGHGRGQVPRADDRDPVPGYHGLARF